MVLGGAMGPLPLPLSAITAHVSNALKANDSWGLAMGWGR